MVVLNILKESFLLALQELNNNKLRSFLSLLGITIGILCIISVFAAINSLEKNLKGSLSQLGEKVIYVQKWPWAFGSDYPWWKYINRPEPSFEDFKALDKYSEKSKAISFQIDVSNRTIINQNKDIGGINVSGITQDHLKIYDMQLESGRFFSGNESNSGDNAAVIGYSVAEKLFPSIESAIGKEIKVLGKKTKVVGVIAKEGESIISWDFDETVMLPYNYMITLLDKNSGFVNRTIIVEAKEEISVSELKDELTGILRKSRRIKPKQEADFALNQVTVLYEGINQTFGLINFAGLLIGGFSILVGGFGIANIMFVSVKERTNIIGIKKALGAKYIFIMLEFLIESIVLCIIGGLIGLTFVYLLFSLANQAIEFTLVLSANNVILGIGISIFIGILSGIFPATAAARLDPVNAMRK